MHILDKIQDKLCYLPIDAVMDSYAKERKDIGGGPPVNTNMDLSFVILRQW
jgi:hypothetical protein